MLCNEVQCRWRCSACLPFSIFHFLFDNSILLWTVHVMRLIRCDLLQDDSTNSHNDIAFASSVIKSLSAYKLTTKSVINFIQLSSDLSALLARSKAIFFDFIHLFRQGVSVNFSLIPIRLMCFCYLCVLWWIENSYSTIFYIIFVVSKFIDFVCGDLSANLSSFLWFVEKLVLHCGKLLCIRITLTRMLCLSFRANGYLKKSFERVEKTLTTLNKSYRTDKANGKVSIENL